MDFHPKERSNLFARSKLIACRFYVEATKSSFACISSLDSNSKQSQVAHTEGHRSHFRR